MNTFRPEFDVKKERVIYNTINILNTNEGYQCNNYH